MSYDDPAKKLKLFHVRKVHIIDSSLTKIFTFPSVSCFSGRVEALLAAKMLLKNGKISYDIVLMGRYKWRTRNVLKYICNIKIPESRHRLFVILLRFFLR